MVDTGFTFNRAQPIPALNLTVEEYTHRSGAKHFHLANDYAENVFMVAFRTVPEDSRGVAHILEHTALCGSEKFPVRDPFFMMIRRSLNTFMNAFTTSDYTAYPFASQNRKDYFNLMEVYLDAVFFSRLDPLDFAQEGHRVEFENTDDPDSPLVYKGVVYNEMKGDTSSPMSMLYHGIQEMLYPSSTYHFNSGGDPRAIPELTYEVLKEFYETHYHPSNAVFMTFGDINAQTQQQKISELALNRLPAKQVDRIAVQPETRYASPVSSQFTYPVDDDDLTGKTHIVLAWLLGKNTDLMMLLKCHLLSDVLLDTSASPLRQALEKTDLATAASPMCGFEEDHMEMNFMCGVEGSEPEHADAIEALIMNLLGEVAEQGVAEDRLEAVLHQLELSQREIGGDGWPYGLQLIFSCMSAAVHRGDPIGLLDLDSALEELRQQIKNPEFIKNLVKELLIDNPHRVKIVMKPDRELGAQLLAAEKRTLEEQRQSLTDDEKQNVIRLAKALNDRQNQEEDLSVLPQVTRDDIPATKSFPAPSAQTANALTITSCPTGTNGISYQQIVSALPELDEASIKLLPIYSQIVTEVGSGGRDYLETQHQQHSVTGGISAFTSFRSDLADCDQYQSFVTLSSRTLNRKAPEMAALLKQTMDNPRFDELDRIKELVQQLSMRRVNSIAGSGHQYAMSAASAPLSPVTGLSDVLSGIPGILFLKKLAQSLDNPELLSGLSAALSDLHGKLRSNPGQLLLIADDNYLDKFAQVIKDLWSDELERTTTEFKIPSSIAPQDRSFVVTTQVNYCAAAYKTVSESSDDAAALSVLAGVLRNNYLHAEVREKGGAYGGGAGHDGTNGVFRFYSYRDPRINETFQAFDQAIDWVKNKDVTDAMLEEAVLGIISTIDAPGSPAGEIRQAFHHGLFGRNAGHREKLRRRFLEVRQDDLKRVSRTYLTSQPSRALVTSENRLKEVDNRFEIITINEE
jgi:Zn-dependent M16 (insulinase) family peptidase